MGSRSVGMYGIRKGKSRASQKTLRVFLDVCCRTININIVCIQRFSSKIFSCMAFAIHARIKPKTATRINSVAAFTFILYAFLIADSR